MLGREVGVVKTSLVEVEVVKTRALVGWAGKWEWLRQV